MSIYTKTKRGESWKHAKEISLCMTVISIGEDGDTATGQMKKKLWDRISEVYETCKPPNGVVRSGGSCESRWRKIRPACTKWREALTTVMAAHASGQNATDLELQEKSIYRALNLGKEFKYAHCWNVLRDSLKFSQPPSLDTPIIGPSPIHLDEDEVTPLGTSSNSNAHPRPMGQKAQKEAKKKKGENYSSDLLVQMKRIADQGDRDHLYRVKVYERSLRAEEEKTMRMDASKLSPRMQAYWERRQEEILDIDERRIGDSGGSSNQSDAYVPPRNENWFN